MRYLLLVTVLFAVLSLEAKTFVREYTYRAGEADSKLTARAIALEQVKRLLLEEVGVYVKSTITNRQTEEDGKLSELTETDIQVLSAGITQTKVIQENWNGETFYLKAELTVDENDVLTQLDKIINDEKNKDLLEKNREITDNALSEIERLKQELDQEKDKNKQLELQQSYAAVAEKLSAVEYYEKGAWYYGDGNNVALALENFQNSVKADSTYEPSWMLLGFIHKLNKDFGSAIAAYEKAYALNHEPKTLVELGECYSDMYRYDRATEYFNQALSIDPTLFDAVNNLAYVCTVTRQFDQAVAYLHKLVELGADSLSMDSRFASVYFDKGDYPMAEIYYLRITENEPIGFWNWHYLANTYSNMGQYQKAIAALQKGWKLNADDTWAPYLIAMAYRNLNDPVNERKYHILAAQKGIKESQDWCTSQNIKW